MQRSINHLTSISAIDFSEAETKSCRKHWTRGCSTGQALY
jgi:hypothetical protein